MDEASCFKAELTLPGTLRSVADRIVQSLVQQEFGILARIEFTTIPGVDEDGSRSMVLVRCCYPRKKMSDSIVRCSALLHKDGDNQVRVELSRLPREDAPEERHILKLKQRVDEKLQTVLNFLALST